ncbi:CBS domain-containing protein [Halomicroarcula sp. GCM10025743]|uniref:CBS domain-containing protein n=1 Tax=Haloarcula TaxID=2237 RepID=UPI00361F85DF
MAQVALQDVRAVRRVERDVHTVSDVMTTEILTVGRLLVTDEDGEFLGLLTRSDIMTALSIIKSSNEYGALSGSESQTMRPEP